MSSENTQEKKVQVSGVMRGYSHKERLKAFKNISPQEKKRIEAEERAKTIPEKTFMGITGFNKSNNAFINEEGEIYNHIIEYPTKKDDIVQSVHYEKRYTIYCATIGKGNRPIFIKTTRKLHLGDNKIYLKPLSEQEIRDTIFEIKKIGLEELCKQARVKLKKGEGNQKEDRNREEILQDFISQGFIFFKPTLPIDPTEIITKVNNPLETIRAIFRNNTKQIDEDLTLFYAADVPEADPETTEPRKFMPYANHKIIISNGGVGKSTLGFLASGEGGFENVTEAGLLGFATAKDKKEGKIHHRTKNSYLEEIQEEKGEELYGKLHTYMEQGEMNITKGVSVHLKGWSSLTFQGNPKDKQAQNSNNLSEYLITQEFISFLEKVSKNTEPFGRRIGLIIFDKELKTIIGVGRDNEEEAVQIIRTIAEGFKQDFSELFENKQIVSWLNKEYSREYKEVIQSLIRGTSEENVQDFLKGHINSYRHARGLALRLAWLDNGLPTLWENDEIDHYKLIEIADGFLDKVLERNLKSFRNFLNSLNSGVFEEIQKFYLNNISPEYVKLATYSFFEWYLNTRTEDKIVPLIEVENYYSEVKQSLGITNEHKYRSFSTIKKSFDKFKPECSVLENFGLSYDKRNNSFLLLNEEKIQSYAKLYEVTKVTKVTKNRDDDNNLKSQRSQKSQKEGKSSSSVTFVTCNPANLQKNSNFQIRNNHDLLQFLQQANKPVSFEEILKHCDKSLKPELLEAMLKSYENTREVFSPKPNYWGAL